ncbi:MAG: hypothetical protein J7L39_04225 [Candidatus Aenigmarchaeota archaeon]|nr:hypothetical protein [Candidatus Aenigmarchaeota archaeon]
MELVLKVKKEDLNKVKETLLKDPEVSRLSIKFRDGNDLGIDGFIIYISGPEDYCKKAEKIVEEITEKVEDELKENVLKKLKEEEERAIQGFGSLI